MSKKKEIWTGLFYVYYAILIPTNPIKIEQYVFEPIKELKLTR